MLYDGFVTKDRFMISFPKYSDKMQHF